MGPQKAEFLCPLQALLLRSAAASAPVVVLGPSRSPSGPLRRPPQGLLEALPGALWGSVEPELVIALQPEFLWRKVGDVVETLNLESVR